MKRIALCTVVLVLVAAGWLGAASMVEEETDEAAAAVSQFAGILDIAYDGWEAGTTGGRFVMSTFVEPKSFNGIVAKEVSTTDITSRLYSSAVRRNQMTLEWEPALAESWMISEDQKSITLTLRPNLVWSDGDDLTAEDFVFSVNEIYYHEDVETSARNALMVGGEPSVWELIDERTFKITLPSVYAGIFEISSIAPAPMHILAPLVEEQGAAAVNSFWGVDTDVTAIPSSGPFVIAEYVPGERVILHRNPNYYERDDAGVQLPYVDEFVMVIVEDMDTQLAKFLAGELDLLEARGEDISVLLDRKAELDFELYSVGPAFSTQFITFNQNPIEGEEDAGIEPPVLDWLSNASFRQAMAHLIDRQTIVDNVYYGFAYPQYSFIPLVSPYYWADAPMAAFGFNPESAKELLDAIDYVDRDGDGWREDPAGNRIQLTLNTNSGNRQREAIGEIFTQEARAIGIDLSFEPEDFNSLVTKLVATYDWQMILIGLTGSIDPIGGQNVYPSTGNLHMIEPGQTSPRREWETIVDAAWDEANLTTDEEQRKRGFQKIQEQWIEQVPWAYTVNSAVIHAFKNTWGNLKPQSVDGYSWDGIIERIYLK